MTARKYLSVKVKKEVVKKPPIETASWCYRGKYWQSKVLISIHCSFQIRKMMSTMTLPGPSPTSAGRLTWCPMVSGVDSLAVMLTISYPQGNTSSRTNFLFRLTGWTWSGSSASTRVGRTAMMRSTSPSSSSSSPGKTEEFRGTGWFY